MSQLHAYFIIRNQQAFQRLLDGAGSNARGQSSGGGGLSSSGGKSWSKPSPLSGRTRVDVNARDWLGRTVLHLAAASQDASAPEYVRMLLSHPDISVNAADKESHWTALHRALYHGNIASARLLLQRSDVDTSLRDSEGYTAFDLYNSTLEGTQPDLSDLSRADLYTWGANRNAALGLGNGDDRLHPEQVVIRPPDGSEVRETENVEARFSPIRVQNVVMSKLHTAVVTSEDRGNLRICGFGSGGRLGPGQHTQYSLVPLPQLNQTLVSVALGQDHTLALTKSGEVLSWGLNRFSQLGYVVEPLVNTVGLGRSEEPIQATARKVTGSLKNKVVLGVAACKTASACWTDTEVFTWGTNNGQLGYDKSAHPVQVLPRVVTKVTQPVQSVSITDDALACLLTTNDVVCLFNDGHYKVNFPTQAFPSEIMPYRPPQATPNASISKITSCENTFAALSTNGEVFLFTVPSSSESGPGASTSRKMAIVPQRVWALRKKFTAVRDVALGADGSLIICTESGHVFVRARNTKVGQGAGGKAFKFQQVPYLQRVVAVCANVTGAYGALRVDHRPEPIKVVGRLIAQDLAEIQPYLRYPTHISSVSEVGGLQDVSRNDGAGDADVESDDEAEDATIQKDIKQISALCGLLERIKTHRQESSEGLFDGVLFACGADLIVQVQSATDFPAHRLILAARSDVLKKVLSGGPSLQEQTSGLAIKLLPAKASSKYPKLSFSGCQPLSVLLLLAYLYSDDVPALWDRRVGLAFEHRLARLNVKFAKVKTELQALARLLDLSLFAHALEASVKRVPEPSMAVDMLRLFETSQAWDPTVAKAKNSRVMRDPLAPDVVLRLADKDIHSHSTILRARSPFFAAFFDDADWTMKRWTSEGTVIVNLQHLKWHEMKYVTRFLCGGGDEEMFDVLEVRSVDELLDYMFDIMAAANELLIDRLVGLCCTVILKQITITNVCSILSDASHFHATSLVQAVHAYMAANMETLLESRMLDDLGMHLIKQLSILVRKQQCEKYPVSRTSRLVDKAMEAHGDWLATQDIPQLVVPTNRMGAFRDSTKLSPPGPNRSRRPSQVLSPPTSPIIRPEVTIAMTQNVPADDEVFVMDEPEAPVAPVVSSTLIPQPSLDVTTKPTNGWKPISSAPRVDMRAIMAEAHTGTSPRRTVPIPVKRVPSGNAHLSQRGTPPMDQNRTSNALLGLQRAPLDSPWRVPQMSGVSAKPVADSLSGSRPDGTASPAHGSTPGTPRLQPQTTPKKTMGSPGMGPVFSPAKQSPASKSTNTSIRRVSSGSAWTLPPVQPVVQSSSSSSAMSFAAIQQLQLEQELSPAKDKQSLLQIQQEEQARQVEKDFLKWWTAEEARLRAEQQGPAQGTSRPRKAKKPKNAKNEALPSASTKDSRDNQSQGKKSRRSHAGKSNVVQ